MFNDSNHGQYNGNIVDVPLNDFDYFARTVCFFSFVKFFDGVTQKVVEIIDICKMSLEGIVNAFYDT